MGSIVLKSVLGELRRAGVLDPGVNYGPDFPPEVLAAWVLLHEHGQPHLPNLVTLRQPLTIEYTERVKCKTTRMALPEGWSWTIDDAFFNEGWGRISPEFVVESAPFLWPSPLVSASETYLRTVCHGDDCPRCKGHGYYRATEEVSLPALVEAAWWLVREHEDEHKCTMSEARFDECAPNRVYEVTRSGGKVWFLWDPARRVTFTGPAWWRITDQACPDCKPSGIRLDGVDVRVPAGTSAFGESCSTCGGSGRVAPGSIDWGPTLAALDRAIEGGAEVAKLAQAVIIGLMTGDTSALRRAFDEGVMPWEWGPADRPRREPGWLWALWCIAINARATSPLTASLNDPALDVRWVGDSIWLMTGAELAQAALVPALTVVNEVSSYDVRIVWHMDGREEEDTVAGVLADSPIAAAQQVWLTLWAGTPCPDPFASAIVDQEIFTCELVSPCYAVRPSGTLRLLALTISVGEALVPALTAVVNEVSSWMQANPDLAGIVREAEDQLHRV